MIITLVGTLVYEPSTGKIPSGLGRRFQFRIIIVLLFSGSKTLARQIVLPDYQAARLEKPSEWKPSSESMSRVRIASLIINRAHKINVDLHQDGQSLLRMIQVSRNVQKLMLNIPVGGFNPLASRSSNSSRNPHRRSRCYRSSLVLTCKIPVGDPTIPHSI